MSKTITLDEHFFGHLLDCMRNQKQLPTCGAFDYASQREIDDQATIDAAYHKARQLWINNPLTEDNMIARQERIEKRLDAIEARVERLEKLCGVNSGTHDTMIIYWSKEDLCYFVRVPDLMDHVANWNTLAYGNTYEEAAKMGTKAIVVAKMIRQ